LTATNDHDGLCLFMSETMDAIVLDYHLGLLDGPVVAAEIKQVRPQVPIIMVSDHMDLPDGALNSVDAVVAKSDGPRFLLATLQSVLSRGQVQQRTIERHVQPPGKSHVAREASAVKNERGRP
jgi:DNA-binding response OmpR family regulator